MDSHKRSTVFHMRIGVSIFVQYFFVLAVGRIWVRVLFLILFRFSLLPSVCWVGRACNCGLAWVTLHIFKPHMPSVS